MKLREAEKLLGEARKEFEVDFPEVERAESLEVGDAFVVVLNEVPLLVRISERLYPYLGSLGSHTSCKEATVDMGAVPHLANGADVMTPGITEVDDFEEDETVAVRDEEHGKFLVVGRALMSSDEVRSSSHGKAIESVHYVGDDVWEAVSKTF